MTLDELTRLMMASNPQIREAANNVTVAQGRAIQAGLYPNPVVQAASPQLAGNQTQNNIQLSQDYVTRDKIGLDSNAAWVAVRQAELQLVRARFDALTILRQRFYIGLAAQRRVEVLEELVKIARKSREMGMKLLEGRREWGRTDAIMLDIELDRAQVAWENAETFLETNKRQLVAAVGVPSINLPRLAGQLEAELPKYDLIAVQRGVISRNSLGADRPHGGRSQRDPAAAVLGSSRFRTSISRAAIRSNSRAPCATKPGTLSGHVHLAAVEPEPRKHSRRRGQYQRGRGPRR